MKNAFWWIVGALMAADAAAVGIAILWLWPELITKGTASADVLARGQVLYQAHCASCHGADLKGQPNWQTPLPNGRLPAPPHDASGHTWHHPDGMLFRITSDGPERVVGGGYESDMPGFGGILTDEEISAVLHFIKSTWPERQRVYQAKMTRREQGLPDESN